MAIAIDADASAAAPATVRRRDVEVIGLVGLAHGTSHFFHFLLPPLYPWFIRDFALSYTQLAMLMTVFFVVSGVGQALAGFVVDRIGARPVLCFGIGTLAASGLLLSITDGYPMLLATAAVAGLGNSIFHPSDFTLLNRRVSTPRLGHAFSVHGVTGNIGWALAPVVLGGVAAVSDWHVAGLVAGGWALLVLVLLLVRAPVLDAPAAGAEDGGHRARAAALTSTRSDAPASTVSSLAFLRSTAVWLCLVFFFFSTGAFGVLQNFAPTILGKVYGADLGLATAALTAYLLSSAVGTVVGGFVASKTQQRSEFVIAVMLAVSAAMACLLAAGVVPVWMTVPILGLMGFGVGIAGPSRDLLVRRAATAQFGAGSYGRVYGFVYSGLDLGLALAPIAAGFLLDHNWFALSLVLVAVFQVAALLAAITVGRAVGTR